MAFEKQYIEDEVAGKDGKVKKEIRPIAVITIRTLMPDVIPVGKIVEITAKEE